MTDRPIIGSKDAQKRALLMFIDDASGKLLQLLFGENESFFSYCTAANGYFRRHGNPIAFYSDMHGIFRVKGDSMILQDRLVKEIHLRGISSMAPTCLNSSKPSINALRLNRAFPWMRTTH